MVNRFFQKGLSLFLKQQTNILSAAFVIMVTVLLSLVLGLMRQRLLLAIFGPSDTVGVYLAAAKFPDLLFQVIIAGALSSAFIPVFSDFISKGKEKEGHVFASNLLTLGLGFFFIFSLVLLLFADFFSHLLASQAPHDQLILMANLMRIIIVGQILFIIGSFLAA